MRCLVLFLMLIFIEKSFSEVKPSIQVNDSRENINRILSKSEYYLKTNIDSSFLLATEAATLSGKIQDTILLLKSLDDQSKIKETLSQFEEAIEINNRAMLLSIALKDSSLIWNYLNKIGYFYLLKADYTSALHYYIEALQIAEKVGVHVAESNRNIAMIFKSQKNYPKAIEYLEKSLKIWMNENDSLNVTKVLANIAGNMAVIGEYKDALNYLFQAQRYASIIRDTNLLSDITISIANIYNLQSEYKKAEEYYNKAIELKSLINDKKGLANLYNNISFFYSKNLDFGKSEKYSKLALECALKTNQPNFQMLSYKSLSFIYSRQKKYDLAYLYQNKYIQLKDSLFSIEKSQQIAEIETKYETVKKAQQIKILESENKVKEAEIKHRMMERNLLIAGIALLALLVFFILKGYRQKQKTNEILNEKNILIEQQKVDLDHRNKELNKINATKDKLFSIIAHDLRSPMNSMEGISDIIRQLLASGRVEKLDAVAQHIDQTISRLNLLLENLLGWSLSQINGLFVKAEVVNLKIIADYSVNIQKPALAKKNIELNVEIDDKINVKADQNMLRTILRNLISNAIKFTPDKGNITLGAWHDNHFVYIFVKDSGIGIPTEKMGFIFELNEKKISTGTDGSKGTGLGLNLCKELVNLNGGDIKINSEVGKGTEVIFTLPLTDCDD